MTTQHTMYLERVAEKVGEVAVKVAEDYPGVAEAEPMEQLYAIEASYEGCDAANKGLHKIIEVLRLRLELSVEDVVAIHEEINS